MLRIDCVSEDVCARTEISAHKRLVMTGGTSGFGRRVLERLLAEYKKLARQSARSRQLWGMRRRGRLTVIDTDLGSLKSVIATLHRIDPEAFGFDQLENQSFRQAIPSSGRFLSNVKQGPMGWRKSNIVEPVATAVSASTLNKKTDMKQHPPGAKQCRQLCRRMRAQC